MQQSNVIAASILFAFLVYVTVRGQLGKYIGIFL